jgi:nucleotide-binding universal stress UspA family protein
MLWPRLQDDQVHAQNKAPGRTIGRAHAAQTPYDRPMPTSPKEPRAFKSILCPVDLSATSRGALRTARVLAEKFTARLSVLFVDDPLLARAALRFDEDELARRTRAELARFVEKAIGTQPRCSIDIVSGNPADEIIKAVRRAGADLIVMGTQGRSGTRRLFFGSTAEAVLRRSAVPVLAVPPGKTA